MSIEQHQEFHIARRILRSFAPEYRLLATPMLSPGAYVLDVHHKTVEVAEGTEINEAIAKILFLMGHVGLSSTPLFAPLFGKHLRNHKGPEQDLINALAELGSQADLLAARWAVDTFIAFWDVSTEEAKALVEGCCMSEQDWRQYFS